MSNDLISYTSLTSRVRLACVFWIDLYISYTETSQESFFLTWASQVRIVGLLLSRNCLLHRLHLKSSPACSPPPMSSVSLSRHGVYCYARSSSHSIACKAIIYRRFVFCLTSVWRGSSSLCLNESLVSEGCGILAWISHLQEGCLWCKWS